MKLNKALLLIASLVFVTCQQPAVEHAAPPPPRAPEYAVYGEYARESNKKMANGLNRRVFNKTEAQAGNAIRLSSDGCITLEPGTYRLTGFSMVSMQTGFAPPQPKNNNNYPGYCLVYRKDQENSGRDMLAQAIAIGSPATAADMAPSTFEAVYRVDQRTDICVGHQSGNNLHDEVYLSIYDVDGEKSDYHVVARIAITRL